MNNKPSMAVLLVLVLPAAVLAIGPRYRLPEAVRSTLTVTADPALPGTFTLTGTVKALSGDASKAQVSFRLPPEVEAVGPVPEKKGNLAAGKETTVKAKVRLKKAASMAIVGFGVTYDFAAEAWQKYIWEHRASDYKDIHLRDMLDREVLAMKGKRVSVGQTAVLKRGR